MFTSIYICILMCPSQKKVLLFTYKFFIQNYFVCIFIFIKIIYSEDVYQRYVDKVKTIQRRFLKFLAFKTDGVYPERGYSQQNLLTRFGFLDLETRRRNFSMNFLKKLIKYKIDCPDLLSQISLHVTNKGTRQSRTFYISIPRTNVLKFSPLHQMCTYYMSHKTTIFSGDC
jgi:hypothetical protein